MTNDKLQVAKLRDYALFLEDNYDLYSVLEIITRLKQLTKESQ